MSNPDTVAGRRRLAADEYLHLPCQSTPQMIGAKTLSAICRQLEGTGRQHEVYLQAWAGIEAAFAFAAEGNEGAANAYTRTALDALTKYNARDFSPNEDNSVEAMHRGLLTETYLPYLYAEMQQNATAPLRRQTSAGVQEKVAEPARLAYNRLDSLPEANRPAWTARLLAELSVIQAINYDYQEGEPFAVPASPRESYGPDRFGVKVVAVGDEQATVAVRVFASNKGLKRSGNRESLAISEPSLAAGQHQVLQLIESLHGPMAKQAHNRLVGVKAKLQKLVYDQARRG